MDGPVYIDASFVANSGWSSRCIEYFGAGSFSHVDIVLPDSFCIPRKLPMGSLLGARSDVIGGIAAGVQIRGPGYEKWPKRLVLRIPCTIEQQDDALRFLMAQLYKPYDKASILGFITGRNWRDEDAWFCSELFTRMLEVSGISSALPIPFYRITPGAAALVAAALGGIPISKLGIS